jgi:hypothetical protein
VVLNTGQLRSAYYPPCADKGKDFLAAYRALDAVFRKWNYRVGSGSGAYNCRPITNGSGYSLHAYPDKVSFTFWNGFRLPYMACAVDINPSRNPYSTRLITDMPRGMIDEISRIRTKNGKQVWYWGGYFAKYHDAMHFQVCCSPADLRTGIAGSSTPSPTPTPEEDIVATLAELNTAIKVSEDRQNAWTRAEIDRHIEEVKTELAEMTRKNAELRDTLAALIRRFADKLGVTDI